MSKITVPLEVEQATYELAMGAGQFAVDVVHALANGFQPFQDIAAIGSAAITDLVPVASDFAKLAADQKEDSTAFMAAWMKAGLETYKKLVQK